MATKVTLPGSEIIDFNLKVENKAKYFYKFKTWTPIMGALLLTGIDPPNYWCDSFEQVENSTRLSLVARFDELVNRMLEKNRKPLSGLDGEILGISNRLHQTRKVLWEWDDKCEDDEECPPELTPSEFVAWLEEVCYCEEIGFFDTTWLNVFLKLHGLESKKTILPANLMKSFQKVTEIGDDGGRHPLGSVILQAQQQAKSNCTDPFDIEVIFPLMFHILDTRGVIDRLNQKYIPGKKLPVKLDDGRIYFFARDSLRVHLNRLKKKYFRQPQ